MSGHRPWSMVRKSKPKLAAAPVPAPVPATPAGELVWGPVSFRGAPEDLIRVLIKTLDEGRILDSDVEKMIDWVQADSRNFTLTWTELS